MVISFGLGKKNKTDGGQWVMACLKAPYLPHDF